MSFTYLHQASEALKRSSSDDGPPLAGFVARLQYMLIMKVQTATAHDDLLSRVEQT